MLVRFDRLAAATVSTLAVLTRTRAAASCSWHYDCFTSPEHYTYALSACGNSTPIDTLRDAFVAHCNATPIDAVNTDYWRTVRNWAPIFLYRKQHHVEDAAFVHCMDTLHTSNGPLGPSIATAAVLLSAAVFVLL